MAKQKAKKRHIANSDIESENSYPASQPTNSKIVSEYDQVRQACLPQPKNLMYPDF